MDYNRGERGEKDEDEMENEGQKEDDENDRYWSSCSNGCLNRRYTGEAMDDGSNPSPPLGWHLSWYDRHHQGEQVVSPGPSKADRSDPEPRLLHANHVGIECTRPRPHISQSRNVFSR